MELHAEDATEFQLTIPLGDEQVAAQLVARDPFAEGARVTLDDSELNQDLVRSTKHFVSEDVSSGTHVSLALTDRGTLTGLFGVGGLNYLVSFDQDGLNTRLAERSFVAQAALMGGVSDVQPRSPRGAVVNPTAQSKSAGGAMGSSDKPLAARTPATCKTLRAQLACLDKAVVDLGGAAVGFYSDLYFIDVPAGSRDALFRYRLWWLGQLLRGAQRGSRSLRQHHLWLSL